MDNNTLRKADRVSKILYEQGIPLSISPDSSGIALATKNASIGFYYIKHRGNMNYYFISYALDIRKPTEYFRDFRLLHKRVLALVSEDALT